MMYDEPEPTLLPIQWIFNFPHYIGREELAFDDTVSYTQWGHGLQHNWANSPPPLHNDL